MFKATLKWFYDPTASILAVLVALALVGAWNYAEQMPGIDYYVAWIAADATRNDLEDNLYSNDARKRVGPHYARKAMQANRESRMAVSSQVHHHPYMTATPFLYWTIDLFSSGEYDADLTRWHAISLLAFIFGIFVFCRASGFSLTGFLALLLPCLVWMEPLHADLRVANVNSFQVGLLGLTLFFLGKEGNPKILFAAGVCVSFLVMFKPNLAAVSVILLGAWLIRGEYQKLFTGLAGMVAGTLFAFAISSYFFGSSMAWLDWLQALSDPVLEKSEPSVGNLSPIQSLDTSSSGFSIKLNFKSQAILGLLLSAVVLGFFWWGRKLDKTRAAINGNQKQGGNALEYAQLLGLACLVQMFVSPLVWTHYYVLAIPMLVVAFRPWQEDSNRNLLSPLLHRFFPAIALLCLMVTPIQGFFNMDPVSFFATVSLVAISILAFLGLWQLRFRD